MKLECIFILAKCLKNFLISLSIPDNSTLGPPYPELVHCESIETHLSSLRELDFVPQATIKGHCCICGKESIFSISHDFAEVNAYSGNTIPNLREQLVCSGCGFNNRQRAALQIFESVLLPDKYDRIYITERTTKLYHFLRRKFKYLTGSEYFENGNGIPGIIHQNVQMLTFGSESFDYILSFDVLEHVSNYLAALREFCRCLKTGGSLFLSVPFDPHSEDHIERCRIENGKLIHLFPPEFQWRSSSEKWMSFLSEIWMEIA